MRILKSNSGVSHLIGYMLTLSLTTVIIAVTIIMTNALIDEKARDAAEIYAENIANRVANAIINVCVLKEQYPNANYSIVLEIPTKLVDRFSYYIEIDKSAVYVRSYDGNIEEKSTIYNVTDKQSIGISGEISSSWGAINISCDSYDYICRFDFGTNTSTGLTGFTRVTNVSNNNNWPDSLKEWNYRTPIIITNPVGRTLEDYQVLIQLDDTNFDYSTANSNGSDLNFTDKDGNKLNYWIERWYPRDTHTSRIWVNITTLSDPEDIIYMYHGKVSASPLSNGSATFDFFDDFTTSGTYPDYDRWCPYNDTSGEEEIYIEDGELVLTNGSAINSTIQVGSSSCVIETKAKTVGDTREASMFARNDGSSGAPYEHGYLFASGNFSGINKNLSIIDVRQIPSVKNSSDLPVSQGWNRLTYIINESYTIVCRYFYENYSVDGALTDTNAPSGLDGHFGLCTTEDDTIAYYDWIFVRKFEADVSESVGSREESIPVAYVCGTESRDYWWVNPEDVTSVEYDDQGISYDFVCNSTNSGSATFKITNLTQYLGIDDCSLIFTVGDPNNVIDGMKINITGKNGVKKGFGIDYCDSYKKILIPEIIEPDDTVDGGRLLIEFDDEDTPGEADYYWAVGDLTIQRGERIINVSGGK